MSLGKSRYLVPNVFTSLNFLLAVWAIILATGSVLDRENSLFFSASFIVYCVLFDKLDGFAAKVLKASSEFGAQFDSLADLIAFGLAPALLVLFTYNQEATEWFTPNKVLVFIGVSLYVLCAALRLARYNAYDASEGDGSFFVGLPSTLAGAINAILILIYLKYDLFSLGGHFVILPIIVLIITAVGMVSPLTIPKLLTRENKAVNYFQLCCIVLCYLFGTLMIYPEFQAALIFIYFSVGGVYSNLVAQHWRSVIGLEPENKEG